MNFHVGQEVICIKAGLGFANPIDVGLVLNKQYIVEDILISYIRVNGVDHYLSPSRFKPIRKTDISVFTEMLNKVPTKEPAL